VGEGLSVQRYIISRLLLCIPTLFGITLLTFVGLRVLLPSVVVDRIVG
jgi:ABC-type dipeptide/oligopeptide/nickel transport system permease component